ncbi:MAG: hypothetical protein JNK04_07885 [Myxococcales bacterium]|nr:hypothetical protein [Myxococcales bacterium]
MNTSLAVSLLCAALVTTFTPGCAPPDADLDIEGAALDEDAVGGTTYVELGEFLQTEADRNAWLAVRQSLEKGFDEVCGDTFCEGDYSNLTPLDFECSVSSKLGKVRECAWTFAASTEAVDAATGKVAAAVPFFVCRITPQAKAGELLAALSTDPLHAALPGLEKSIYDAIGDCFETPLDLEPPSPAAEGSFQDVTDTLEGDDVDAWYTMLASLRDDFEQRCSDSFCEGEFKNLAALRLRCSREAETGAIGSCAWSFAGSASAPKKNGKLRIDRDSTTCDFNVAGTPGELADALANPCAGPSPLLRPLPGSTGTLYDALVACL